MSDQTLREKAVGASLSKADEEVAFEPRMERSILLVDSGVIPTLPGEGYSQLRVSVKCRRDSEFRWYHG